MFLQQGNAGIISLCPGEVLMIRSEPCSEIQTGFSVAKNQQKCWSKLQFTKMLCRVCSTSWRQLEEDVLNEIPLWIWISRPVMYIRDKQCAGKSILSVRKMVRTVSELSLSIRAASSAGMCEQEQQCVLSSFCVPASAQPSCMFHICSSAWGSQHGFQMQEVLYWQMLV